MGLLKAVIGIAVTPIMAVADVVTLGGALTDKPDTYTGKNVKAVLKNIEEAVKP